MKKDLIMFVDRLPTQSRNTFFESELPFLSKKFNRVSIIPLYNSESSIQLPRNAEIVSIDFFTPVNRIAVFYKYFLTVVKIYFTELYLSPHRLQYLFHLSKNLNLLLLHIAHADGLKNKVGGNNL